MSSSALADRRCTQPQPGRRKAFTLAVAWWPSREHVYAVPPQTRAQ